jgi:hypothetical protein
LIDAILQRIPPERADDVVLLDPADEDFPVGFNILSAHSELEKNLLASDLVAVFRRLSTSWGDQMNAVLGNAIIALLESNRGGTLIDLRRFLVEPAFRREFLSTVQDQDVIYYWMKEFPLLSGRPQGPVLTRLDTFLRPKVVRYMVGQKDSRLDFADVMDRGKIFLARLSHGAIGEENAHLLGTLLVSKFHQVVLGRQRIAETERRYFWLYVDEFQNFATPSMAAILSGARKYRLGLILAHQELHQLASKAPEVASAVAANPFTRVCFRLGDDDAKKLATGFVSFEAIDLQNLSTGEAICRVERAELDFNLRTAPLSEVDERTVASVRQQAVMLSRKKYAVAREEVEAELLRSRGEIDLQAKGVPSKQEKRPVHLFSGLTYCHCGTKMYVLSDTPKYVCQKCRNKIPIVDLEAIFCEQLKSFFLSPAEVAEHLEKADEHLGEKEKLLQNLEGKRAEIQEEIQRVYKLYIDKKLDGEGFEQFYKPLKERQRQTDDELPRLQAEVDLLKINNLSSDAILSEAQDLHAQWPKLTREEKQRIVESVTEKIVIGQGEVSISLCHLPSSEKATNEQRKLPQGVSPASPAPPPPSSHFP